MAKETNQERARQLYLQCQRAYNDTKSLSGTVWEEGSNIIPVPSYFDDAYRVPAELLFKELYRSSNIPQGTRIDFDHKLLELISSNATYNINNLKPALKKELTLNTFEVYFQIYFRAEASTPKLFKQQITLDGIRFTWCSERNFYHVLSLLNHSNDFTKNANNNKSVSLYRRHRNNKFPKLTNESDLRAIKAIVQATDFTDATSKVADAFHDFMSCINVSQAFGYQSVSLSESLPKLKTAIVYTGVFLIRDILNRKIEILYTKNKRHTLPMQKLKMMNNQNKVSFLNNLRKAFNDKSSPIAKRIRYVTLEFASAIDTENPNLRQLGFWRCLEIATRKSNENRKEKDIVKIFQNYYPDAQHWHQQGQLILDARNTYVHQGVSSNSKEPNDFYLNWSQQYAEKALKILLYIYNNRSTWKTEEDIDTFFDCYSKNDRTLELAGKFLSARRRSRKST